MIFKTLLKKEFLSFISSFLKKKNSITPQSPTGALVGFFVVALLLFGVLGAAFFTIFYLLAPSMIENGEVGLYFGFVALGAFFLSIIGSVAAVKNKLYEAKDNDALLSMPIPPKYILFCRLIPVYVECLAFQLVFFVPAIIAYYLNAALSWTLLLQVLLIPVFALLTTAITCLIGRLLAFIMSKVKHKNFVAMALYLLFFVGYFILMSSNGDLVILLVENVDKIKPVFEGFLWIFYQTGLALSGKIVPFIITFAVCVGFFAIVFYRLSVTYIKTVTNTGKSQSLVKGKANFAQSTILKTLLYKEWKRFLSSPLYMMNSGMGCIFALLAGFAMLFTENLSAELISANPPAELMTILPFFVVIFMAALSGMNTISAPSVSLEGKNLWILKTLPAPSEKIIQAKLLFHVLVSAPFSLFAGIAMSIGFKINVWYALAAVVCGLMLIPVQGYFGLVFGLRKPNLNWNSEAEPIKQDFSVFICMLLNIVLSFAVSAFSIFLAVYVHPIAAFVITVVVLAIANLLCFNWTKNRGAKSFNKIAL